MPVIPTQANKKAAVKTANIAELKNGSPIIKINFSFSMAELDRVRSLPERRFHADGKFWSVPVSVDAIKTLLSWEYEIDSSLRRILHSSEESIAVKPVTVTGLKGVLYPYQSEGVNFIESRKGRALIADEMGLGKTVQALAWLQLHPEHRRALIIVPDCVKLNWEIESIRWMKKPKIEVLYGRTPYYVEGDILVINYDCIAAWVPYLISLNLKVLILDEVHSIKNNTAKRTKAVKKLGKGIPYVIGLSGTPIMNRPVEIYNAVSMIDPMLFPNYMSFVRRYCDAKSNGFGLDVNGASNTEELHRKLIQSIMIRRLKKDVLTDLPDKMYSFIPLSLTNEEDYRYAEKDFISFVQKTKGMQAARRASNAEALTLIETLKQLTVNGKLKEAISWIEEFLESGEKLVVFAVHTFVINAIMEAFPNISVKVDGSVTGGDKQKAVTMFQNDPRIKLFVGQVIAAGKGITLTAASRVAFLELPWTPGDLLQAEDRCHRIGQKENVMVYYLLARGTIEEKMAHLLDKKKKIMDSVLDGTVTDNSSLLSELMLEYE